MKVIKLIIYFCLLLSVPIALLMFLHSSSIDILKQGEVTYERSQKENLSQKNIVNFPAKYLRFEKIVQDAWNPPNINKKQSLILDTEDYSKIYSWENKLENSAEEAFGLSKGKIKNYKINTAKYRVLFEYDPKNNIKTVKILKITEKQDNYNIIYFLIILFTLCFLPFLIIYLIYYYISKYLINIFAVQLSDKDEYIIQSAFKNLRPLFLATFLYALANMFFMLSIGYIGVFEGFNQVNVNNYTSFVNISIFNAILSLVLVYYYDLFVVLTSKRVIEFKNQKINKELYFDEIYKVEDGIDSSDIGGSLKIISDKKYNISINMIGDPLKFKKKISELVDKYKKDNNIETANQNNMEKINVSESPKDTLLTIEMMANPEYAKSVIIDTITPKETELPNVRYCQYCGAEFSASENRCPVCEKLND